MIQVKHESPDNGPPYEPCCFCFQPTPFWFELRDVACCQACAGTAMEDQVPFKDEWFKRIGAKEEYERKIRKLVAPKK